MKQNSSGKLHFPRVRTSPLTITVDKRGPREISTFLFLKCGLQNSGFFTPSPHTWCPWFSGDRPSSFSSPQDLSFREEIGLLLFVFFPQRLLKNHSYEFVLDRACVQFEPDEVRYQEVGLAVRCRLLQ